MGKKDKNKAEKKDIKKLLKKNKPPKDLKKECCENYKKGEDKRCKRCPRFDLLKKNNNP